jgi:hypothetical protein
MLPLEHTLIPKLELTAEEQRLYQSIPKDASDVKPGNWEPIANAMQALLASLMSRNAIPQVRLSVFADPRYAESGKYSLKQEFEKNGTRGKEIFRHPHFLPLLHYFINGADLPLCVGEELLDLLNQSLGSSGDELRARNRFAKQWSRQLKLPHFYTATQFFRLAIDLGLSPQDAGRLRKSALEANYR